MQNFVITIQMWRSVG